MKKISIIVPCYNDARSVEIMYDTIKKLFDEQLQRYYFELIFCDDCSPDNTREEIEKLCARDRRIKGVFNAKNFGFSRNIFFALQQGTGDASFMLFGDLQDPPELLPQFIERWEQGYKVILGQKSKSDESPFIFLTRTLFYKIMDKLSTVKQIQHFNGFGLYDKSFIEVLQSIEDPQPYLKGIVGEFAFKQSLLQYEQRKSNRGRSNVNFWRAYDLAMQGITSYTKTLMRIATFIGAFLGIVCALFAIYILVSKLLNWSSFPTGTASIMIGVFLIGAVQLFFIGILGEYLLSVNARSMRRPLVVVEKRVNFETEPADQDDTMEGQDADDQHA